MILKFKNAHIIETKCQNQRYAQKVPILEAEFTEFKPCFKFETRLKHGWLHLKLYSVSRFEPVLNWNRFLAVQRRCLNSLNSASGLLVQYLSFCETISLPHAYPLKHLTILNQTKLSIWNTEKGRLLLCNERLLCSNRKPKLK